ncbi:MAG TPA: integrase arm-type DNA-binding domain-containing protein [Vicinamibacterales bacterium]|nr:integrase arm-type DNA-binding domain-containing protein [Vicinamibacterales bacterium]
MALTDRFIASLHPAGRVVYFDTKTRGLALRGTPSGSKTWAFVYRIGGKPTWITLGAYPAVTLADARVLALNSRHSIDVQKRDPATELRAARQAAKAVPQSDPAVFTFADMAKVYEAFAKGKKKTWQDDIGKVKRHLMPAWGNLPLRHITRRHVHEVLDSLVAKGMTVGVNRVQAVISRLFTVALDRSLVEAHPAARMIKRFKERPSDRVLTDDELRALSKGLDACPGRAADALRLRLFLGQRGEEINGMRWSEIDLKAKTWDLPGARTKNSRPHSVPLSPTAVQILERRRAEIPKREPQVFPGLNAWASDYRALSEIASGAYEWKDLRRTLSTRLAALGFGEEVVGRALNHAKHTVTARHYIKHDYLAETRRALDAWDRELARIFAEEEAEVTNLVPFRK